MKLQDLLEEKRVHTIRNPDIKPRGAPEDRARAFDPEGMDRSVLKAIAKEGKYFAVEAEDADDFATVCVMGDGVPEIDIGTKYHGVNVLFMRGDDGEFTGEVDTANADKIAKAQWSKDRDKIIAAAKLGLKDPKTPGIYDGLGGKNSYLGKVKGVDKL